MTTVDKFTLSFLFTTVLIAFLGFFLAVKGYYMFALIVVIPSSLAIVIANYVLRQCLKAMH